MTDISRTRFSRLLKTKLWGVTEVTQALRWADVVENQNSVVGLLLKHGADVNVRDDFNNTAIHHAVMRGNIEATRLLINYGADLTAHDFNGKTPIEMARDSNNTDLVKLLDE